MSAGPLADAHQFCIDTSDNLEPVAGRLALLELESFQAEPVAEMAQKKMETMPFVRGVRHGGRLEADMLEVQAASPCNLLVPATAAHIAIAGFHRSSVNHLPRRRPGVACLALEFPRSGGRQRGWALSHAFRSLRSSHRPHRTIAAPRRV